jgi:hypothetical protein
VATNDGHAIVAAESWNTDPFVWEYDLETGSQGPRLDAGGADVVDDFLSFDRSWDGSSALLRWFPLPCCPLESRGQFYDVGSAVFGPVAETGGNDHEYSSLSKTGEWLLVGGSVFDSDLTEIAALEYPRDVPDESDEVISALSPDGSTAYFAQRVQGPSNQYSQIVPVDVATGSPGKVLLVPEEMERIIAHPNASELIAVAGGGSLYVFELD